MIENLKKLIKQLTINEISDEYSTGKRETILKSL